MEIISLALVKIIESLAVKTIFILEYVFPGTEKNITRDFRQQLSIMKANRWLNKRFNCN